MQAPSTLLQQAQQQVRPCVRALPARRHRRGCRHTQVQQQQVQQQQQQQPYQLQHHHHQQQGTGCVCCAAAEGKGLTYKQVCVGTECA